MSKTALKNKSKKMAPRDFLERLAQGLTHTLQLALDAETLEQKKGWLQCLDPRYKLVCLVLLIISTVLSQSLLTLLLLFLLACLLAFLSKIDLTPRLTRLWGSVLFFTGVIALPALVMVPGVTLWEIPILRTSISVQGLRSALFLIGRAETTATFALLLVLTTPWPHVLKAMRSLGAPLVLVAILGMTHRYIFVLLHSTRDLLEARRSRMLSKQGTAKQRQMIISAAAVLLSKTFRLSSEVHLAMISRGYRGEIYLLHEFQACWRDRIALFISTGIPILILWNQA